MRKLQKRFLGVLLSGAMVVTSLPSNFTISTAAVHKEKLRQELAAYAEDYPEGAFAFYKTGGSIAEGDRDQEVLLVRLGDTSQKASVDVKCLDVTAEYGKDYTVYTKAGLKKNVWEAAKSDSVAETLLKTAENKKNSGSVAEEDGTEKKDTKKSRIQGESFTEAYQAQTGKALPDNDWREALEEYQQKSASIEAENELINTVDGAGATIEFEAGEFQKKIYIHVKDDDAAEIEESASLILGNASVGMIGEKGQYTFSIEDNEPTEKIVFGMKQDEIVATKKDGYAEITIVRNSGLDYYASAVYQTVSGTANTGDDYEPVNGGTVSFVPGEKEKTIKVSLADAAKEGAYFDVKLQSDDIYVEEGKESTRIWIEKKEEDTQEHLSETSAGKSVKKAYKNTQNIDGVNYDVYECTSPGLSAYTHSKSNLDQTASETKSFKSYTSGATRVTFDTTLTGMSKNGLIPYYGKNGYICVKGNGSCTAYHEVSDKKNNKTRTFSDTKDISYDESENGNVNIRANTDGLCRDARYTLDKLTLYYPQYTVKLENANQTLKGKNYTSKNESTTFNVSTLKGNASWSSKTLGIQSGSINLTPGTLQNGVEITRYDIYVSGSKVSSVSSTTLNYSDLNKLRNTQASQLKNGKYTVTVKPVYQTKDAKVVFQSQDSSCIGFSGDQKNGTGFKTNDELSCKMIDKVTFTAGSINSQRFGVSSVTHDKDTGKVRQTIETFTPGTSDDAEKYTKTVEVNYNKEYFRVFYKAPKLTVQYHPDEKAAKNANAGVVSLSTVTDPDTILGTAGIGEGEDGTTKEQTITLEKGVSMLSTEYLLKTIMGEGFTSYVGGDGLSYTTKTLWTVKEAGDKEESVPVTGNSYAFTPPYSDTEVYYYFKSIQDDETPVGLTGTVYINETPLFAGNTSTRDASVKTKASGVKMNVGGYAVTTDSEGKYKVDAHFNKGENIGVSLSYDTLSLMTDAQTRKNGTQNFTLKADTTDGITVDSSVMKRTYATGEKNMKNQNVTKTEETTTMMLEDADYTLDIQATGKAGIVPGKAEYHFYSSDGTEKTALKQSVDFSNNSASLKINPMSVGSSKTALEVGDFVTVKLYDTNGKGYFEHHTNIVVAEKLSGMYTFNYQATKKEDDNLFLKAIGGISVGEDFVIDLLSNNAGTYQDSAGNEHQLVAAGIGNGFGDPEDVYDLEQRTIRQLDAATETGLTPKKNDSFSFAGNGSWSLDIQVGAIMDGVLVKSGEKQGQYQFNDYILIGNVQAGYHKEWNTSVGPVNLTFTLDFQVGDKADGDNTGVKWHFYDDPTDNKTHYITSESSIDIMASDDISSKGSIDINTRIVGAVEAALIDAIGVEGKLKVEFEHHSAYETGESWTNSGAVILSPSIKLKLTFLKIPVWTQDWRFDYGNNKSKSKTLAQVVEDAYEDANIMYVSTDTKEYNDFGYLDDAEWNGGAMKKLKKLSSDGAMGTENDIIASGFYDTSKIKIQELGDGKYLAVFLDGVSGRADIDKIGAYYSVYDGKTWSKPVVLEDDGTTDDLPEICEAGDNRYLIVWSDASKKLDENATVGENLNLYNLTGCFYQADTNTMGEAQEITKTTSADTVSDTDPHVSYYKDSDGNETMKIYFTKSEYSISDTEAGEVVGDLLNPVQLIAVRNYDFSTGTWSEEYSDTAKAEIMETIGTGSYDEYVTNWYGQEFLDLAPSVDVTESIDEDGYWTEGTTAAFATTQNESTAKGGDAIAYNGLSLYAYALDKGGVAQTTGDQNLYLQIYNIADDEYHHPIMISGTDSEVSDIQFIRSQVPSGENGTAEVTYLYWLENGVVKRINISNLVKNNLQEQTTEDGQTYYFVDKTRPDDEDDLSTAYEPEEIIAAVEPDESRADAVQQEQESEGETATLDYDSITSFKVCQNGNTNYVVWNQLTPAGEEQSRAMESQLYAVREDASTGDTSKAVQITDKTGTYYNSFDCAVTDDGKLEILAGSETLKEDGTPDETTGKLAFLTFTPSENIVIDDVAEGTLSADEDGNPVTGITAQIKNEGLVGKDGMTVEITNASGEVVYTNEEEQEIRVVGGDAYQLEATMPLEKDHSYKGTITVKKDGEVLAEKEISGTRAPELKASEFVSEVTERNYVYLGGVIANNGVLDSEASSAEYGYISEDGTKVKLGTQEIPALASHETSEIECQAEVDFSKFTQSTLEDGSESDTMQFYLTVNGQEDMTVYSTVELTATADEMTLMKSIDQKITIQPGTTDQEANVVLADSVSSDESAQLQVVIDGKAAENEGDYVGRLKTVWEEVDNDTATVTSDGTVTGKKEGTVKVKGYVLPADDETIVYEGGGSANVDGYQTMPDAAVIPVETEITISKGAEASSTPEPTQEPTISPNASATGQPAVEPTQEAPAAIKVGDVIKDSSGTSAYRVTKVSKNGNEVEYQRYTGKAGSVSVPAKITKNSASYKVTSIAGSAFAKNKTLKKVTIGKNVTKIKAKAFYGCTKLKAIYVKSTKLKKVGKNAFGKIHKKAVFTVPGKRYKKYRKLFNKKTGCKKTMAVRKK